MWFFCHEEKKIKTNQPAQQNLFAFRTKKFYTTPNFPTPQAMRYYLINPLS
jgi:hypothetical protein